MSSKKKPNLLVMGEEGGGGIMKQQTHKYFKIYIILRVRSLDNTTHMYVWYTVGLLNECEWMNEWMDILA